MNPQESEVLAVLKREGVLINVSVRYWRGQKKLKPEDIGLSPGQVSDRLVSLGHKRLIPRESIQRLSLLEGRTHALIEANTFPFLNGLAHFLPNSKLTEVGGALEELKAQFWKAKQEFLGQYQELRSSAVQEWWDMARNLVHDPERLVANIEAAFPVNGNMDRYYGFNVSLFQIALPENLSLDLIDLAEHQEVARARAAAVQDAAARIRDDAQNFIGDCVASLREQTAKLCSEMLESIRSSETGVHQKTLNRLIRFIDHFGQMNFANDEAMTTELERVRKEFLTMTAEEYRNSNSAVKNLTTGLEQLRDHARELARQDAADLVNRFGSLGRRKFQLAA